VRAPVAFALGMIVLAGCGSDPAGAQASAAAVAFVQAEPSRACGLLAPDTEDALARNKGTPCAQALADLHLPTAAEVRAVDVEAESAQVRMDGQVLFLARFPDGWRVTAAGCVRSDPDPAVPYECEVEP